MKKIKNILLGIAIMLATIAFHLMYTEMLWTDLFAVLGFILVIKEFWYMDDPE